MRISSRITALKYKCLYNSLLYINRNNAETKRYQEEGLKLLSGKVDSLPSKIAFRPKFIKQSSCIKVLINYTFYFQGKYKKPLEERFDALFMKSGTGSISEYTAAQRVQRNLENCKSGKN